LKGAGLDGPGVLKELPNPDPPVIPPMFADETAAWEGTDLSPWIASRVRVILCPFFEGERHEAVPVLGRADRQQAASC